VRRSYWETYESAGSESNVRAANSTMLRSDSMGVPALSAKCCALANRPPLTCTKRVSRISSLLLKWR